MGAYFYSDPNYCFYSDPNYFAAADIAIATDLNGGFCRRTKGIQSDDVRRGASIDHHECDVVGIGERSLA